MKNNKRSIPLNVTCKLKKIPLNVTCKLKVESLAYFMVDCFFYLYCYTAFAGQNRDCPGWEEILCLIL
jgi:hypothetical protein